MAINWLSLFIQSATGGIVGYYTNELAIDMLFRRRFGLGGIVLRTHREFIYNISQLVEQEIVTPQALSQAFAQADFRQGLSQLVTHFSDHSLPAWFTLYPYLSNIPELDIAIEHILFDLEDDLQLAYKRLFPAVNRYLMPIELLTHTQVSHISQRLSDILQQIIARHPEDSKWLTDVLISSPDGLLHLSLEQLLGRRTLQSWLGSLLEPLALLPAELHYNFATQLQDSLQALQRIQMPASLLYTLIQRMGEEHLSDYFSEAFLKDVFFILRESLSKVLNSQEGIVVVERFLALLYDELLTVETTLFQILGEQTGEQFKILLQKRLPEILQRIIAFLKTEKQVIDQLIDETFRRHTQSLLQEWLIELFVGRVSEETRIVERIIYYLSNYDTQTLAEKGSAYLIEYLQQTAIGNIIAQIPRRRFVEVLAILVRKGLLNEVEKLSYTQLRIYFHQPIKNWLDTTQWAERLSGWTKQKLPALIQHYLYSPGFEKNWEKLLQGLTDSPIFSQAVTSLVSDPHSFVADMTKLWYRVVHSGQLNSDIEQALLSEIQKRTIEDFIPARQWQQWLPQISSRSLDILRQTYQSLSTKDLLHIYDDIRHAYPLQENLTTYIQQLLLDNAAWLLRDRIATLVRSNLNRLPPERIRDMVEQFMGKEVKPITRLGALLGSIAGGMLYMLPSASSRLLYLGMSSTAYGLTGYATNYLALKMIFRPYQPYRLAGWQLPFTPGVIAKNQHRFAENMGRFVGGHLLNTSQLIERFRQYRPSIEKRIQQHIQKDDYAFLHTLIVRNRSKLSQWLTQVCLESIDQQLPTLIDPILERAGTAVGQTSLQYFDTSVLRSKILEYLQSEAFAQRLTQLITRRIDKTSQWQPTHFEKLFDYVFPLIIRQVNHLLTSEKVLQLLHGMLKQLLDKHKHTPLLELALKLAGEQTWHKYCQKTIRAWIQSDRIRTHIGQMISQRVQAEFRPERPVSGLLGGRLIKHIEKLLDKALQELSARAIAWMQDHKRELADDIYQKAKESNRMAIFYKTTIKQTVYELADDVLPGYLNSRMPVFRQILKQEIHQIGQMPLSRLYIHIQQEELQGMVNTFLQKETTLHIIEQVGQDILNKWLEQLTLAQFVSKPVSLQDLQVYQPLVSWMVAPLYIDQQKASALKLAFQWLPILFYRLYGNIPPSAWAERLQLTEQLPGVLHQLTQHPVLRQQQRIWIDNFFAVVKHQPLSFLVDIDILRSDLHSALHRLWHNPRFQGIFGSSLQTLFERMLLQLNDNLPQQTKHFLSTEFIRIVLDSLDAHLPQLLENLYIQNIVVERITNMHPKKVESLFYGFAQRYFRQLINYGFGFGLVIGLLIDGLLLLLLPARGS